MKNLEQPERGASLLVPLPAGLGGAARLNFGLDE